VLTVEDWAEIRRLHFAEGLAIKEITRRLGVARNTVRQAVRSGQPPVFHRRPRPSAVDAYEPAIRELLRAHPRMPATVIAERIGWPRGITILKERVAQLRPAYLPPDPCQRTDYRPGELAQWDLWFPPVDVPLGWEQRGRLPVLVGVSGYSRWLVARMIPSRQAHDLLGGHLACLQTLGGVPRAGVYDSEPAIGRWRAGRPELTDAFQRFRGALGMGAIVCKPRDPEAKGWWSAPTATWRPHFCPVAALRAWRTSTSSSGGGSRPLTSAGIARWAAAHATGSLRIAPGCARCRRSCPTRPGAGRPCCAATTTCAWTPATTQCIPR
jgi:transposase